MFFGTPFLAPKRPQAKMLTWRDLEGQKIDQWSKNQPQGLQNNSVSHFPNFNALPLMPPILKKHRIEASFFVYSQYQLVFFTAFRIYIFRCVVPLYVAVDVLKVWLILHRSTCIKRTAMYKWDMFVGRRRGISVCI